MSYIKLYEGGKRLAFSKSQINTIYIIKIISENLFLNEHLMTCFPEWNVNEWNRGMPTKSNEMVIL